MPTSAKDRRRYFPADIHESLVYYANEEKIGKSDTVKGLITWDSIAWEILRNELRRMGHYPAKTGKLARDLDRISENEEAIPFPSLKQAMEDLEELESLK